MSDTVVGESADDLISMLPDDPSFSVSDIGRPRQMPAVGNWDIDGDDSEADHQEVEVASVATTATKDLRYGYVGFEELNNDGVLGPVFAATEVATRRVVSVKIIRLKLLEDATKAALLDLLGHEQPHIIELLHLVDAGKKLWLVMEDLQGCNLYGLIRNGSASQNTVIMRICRDVLLALDFLRSKNIIHGDVRSDNILMSVAGRARLSGLDRCHKIGSRAPARQIKGTEFWMAPEMLRKEPCDHKADVWSLGITIIEMVQGSPPFYAFPHHEAMVKIVEAGTPAAGRYGDGLPTSLQPLLQSCLQANPSSRPSANVLLSLPLLPIAPRSEIGAIVEQHEKAYYWGEINGMQDTASDGWTCS